MTIFGLADKTIGKSRERTTIALSFLGLALSVNRIAVNLLAGDIIKESVHFDFAIEVGALVAMGSLPQHPVDGYLVLGEL